VISHNRRTRKKAETALDITLSRNGEIAQTKPPEYVFLSILPSSDALAPSAATSRPRAESASKKSFCAKKHPETVKFSLVSAYFCAIIEATLVSATGGKP
jgi:hypothetical protein